MLLKMISVFVGPVLWASQYKINVEDCCVGYGGMELTREVQLIDIVNNRQKNRGGDLFSLICVTGGRKAVEGCNDVDRRVNIFRHVQSWCVNSACCRLNACVPPKFMS